MDRVTTSHLAKRSSLEGCAAQRHRRAGPQNRRGPQGPRRRAGHRIASAIKADVPFYRETKVITADELIRSSTDNTRFIFSALPVGQSFDTSPAIDTGSLRAAVGVPLPAVMAAFRVAAHHIWDVMIEIARTDPQISSEALLRATKRIWQAQMPTPMP